MPEIHELTQESYDKCLAELKELVEVLQPKANEELEFARSQGDLSENADYDAARERYESNKRRIAELQDIRDHHRIIVNTGSSIIGNGSKVKLETLSTHAVYEFTITGEFESDIRENKLSNNSPVGKAIHGKTIGDIVEIPVKKPYQMKIIDVK